MWRRPTEGFKRRQNFVVRHISAALLQYRERERSGDSRVRLMRGIRLLTLPLLQRQSDIPTCSGRKAKGKITTSYFSLEVSHGKSIYTRRAPGVRLSNSFRQRRNPPQP